MFAAYAQLKRARNGGGLEPRLLHRLVACQNGSVPEWLKCARRPEMARAPTKLSARNIRIIIIHKTYVLACQCTVQMLSHSGTLIYSTMGSHSGTLMYSLILSHYSVMLSHSGTLMYSIILSHSGTLMYSVMLSHSGTLMYSTMGSHSGTLMYSVMLSHSGTLIYSVMLSHSGTLIYSVMLSHSGTLMYSVILSHSRMAQHHTACQKLPILCHCTLACHSGTVQCTEWLKVQCHS